MDASYIFKEYGPQKVPTLREYLELVKDTDIITNIELKTGVFELSLIHISSRILLIETSILQFQEKRKFCTFSSPFLEKDGR